MTFSYRYGRIYYINYKGKLMEDISKLKKSELLQLIEDLQLENISLRAEVTILREQAIKRAKHK